MSSSTEVLSACCVHTWGLRKLTCSDAGRFISVSSRRDQWRGRFLPKVIQSNKASIRSLSLGLHTCVGCRGNLGRLPLLDCSYLLGPPRSAPRSPVTSCPAVQVRAHAASVSADLLLSGALPASISSRKDWAVLSSFWPSFPIYYL